MTIKTSRVRSAASLALLFVGFGCSVATTPKEDSHCSSANLHTVTLEKVLHKNDVGDSALFYVVTPDAFKDCHATYFLEFKWASPARRVWDASRPVLADLSTAFSPGGLRGALTYFDHPEEVYDPKRDSWQILFSVGDKNAPGDSSTFAMGTALDNPTSDDDSVWVKTSISYYEYR